MHGDLEMTQALFEKGADANAKNGSDKTPLAVAQHWHFMDIIQLLSFYHQ
jgi:hypothetical protein